MNRRLLPALALIVFTVASCGGEDSPQPAPGNNNPANNGGNSEVNAEEGPAEQRREALAEVGNVTLGLYTDFEVDARALQEAARAFGADPSDANRTAAQDAWKTAMATWQRAEVTQFGPAGAMSLTTAGEDLRDFIYSWPLTNACRIDQEIVANEFDTPAFESERINVKGLDAMEYLLFVDSTENECAPNSRINLEGTWAALTPEQLRDRRARYTAVLADGVVESTEQLITWWSPEGKDFLSDLAQAGDGSDVYPTSQEALNAVSDALFYLEKETKDMKVAPPIGLTTCDADLCPEARESLWANVSLANVRANLDGFAAVFRAGFVPLLRAKGADELADELETKLQGAIDAFAALDQPMLGYLEGDPQPLVDAHEDLRSFVTLFRTQFLSVLDLELPQRAEGDND